MSIRLIVFAVLLVIGTVIFMPTLSPQAWGLWVLIAFCAFLAALLPGRQDHYDRFEGQYTLRVTGTVGAIVIGFLVVLLSSSAMLNSSAHFELLGKEKVVDFDAPLPPIDLQKAPLVSVEMAKRAAEKKLSEEAALGSQVEIGRFEKQLVRGDLYWVAFLEHRGFFKWFSQGSTPGYVLVSAHDASVVDLVTEVAGKQLEMRYLKSAFFGDNLDRHLYLTGYASTLTEGYVPEIDDDGRPYLVIPVFDRKVVLGGADVTGAIVLDVQTGESKHYSLADVPAWIDRVHPASIVEAQLAKRLNLIHGWLNPSDKDRLGISGDLDIVYGTDGRSYYFAGHTSVAREGGLVSFSLIDSRTKEATRYTLSGVTESIAQQAAEGVMPEKKYRATNALPFTVNGVATYVMALQDGTGIARAYAMVSIEDFQKVAVAETLAATARLYQAKLATDKTRLDVASGIGLETATAKVLRLSAEVRGGNTTYLFLLEGQGGLMFAAGPDLSDELALTREGDLVEVKFAQGGSRMVGLMAFRNMSLDQLKPNAGPSAEPAPAQN